MRTTAKWSRVSRSIDQSINVSPFSARKDPIAWGV